MELEEFKQKFNLPRISEYVALLSQEQKKWFWELLSEIKQVFPEIDIYHAGSSKYGYLGFGRKKIQAKRVEDFLFVLHLEKNGNFILYITDQTYRLLHVDEDVLPQGYDQSVQKELNLKDWLDQVKTFTEELDLDYSGEDLYPVNYEVEDYFTTLEAYNFLKTKYQKTKEATKKIVGFRNNSNRELALILENSKPSLFLGVDPEDNQYFQFKFIDNNSKIFGKYDENEGRHDGLKSHAPSLYKGNKAYYIEINSLSDLEKFCEWYELAIQNSLTNSHPKEDKEMPDQIIVQPLNRILFGAAGTGKTFNTINHALSIIEDKSLEDLEKEEREDLKNRFDEYKNKGQIKFVTFHQSFSYEDFVEGIRAETNDQGNLRYEVKSGIFKEICELTKTTEFRSILGKEFGRGYILQAVSSDVLTVKKPNGNLIHLSVDLANLLLESVAEEKISIEDLSEKTALDKLDNNHGLLEPYIVNGYNSVWANLIKLVLEFRNQNNQPTKPHVLIIDEINRGNISRIFGELITLIEATKRAGADEALSVTLPYSKEEFAVPDNVYIIGTMNSSDRSLTGLDIALRRRFTFIEMPPQPNLLKDMSVEGVDIERLLTVINQRIEILIDRDHCIGHANFMVLKEQPTLENLAHIFKQKIIPQLQEYFFDDWAKINLVLNGNGMLKPKPVEKSVIFPNVDSEDLGYFEDKKTWELVPTSFKSIASFAKIIQH
ncbi:McrB family protein [Acinetobacter sp. WCHA39]|uniref:McrB family protein n=1 Tax=Acinetobacter sp. WCHA39 TaxID=2004648 RepID=UPI000B3C5556|nr:AAA family ATPase [Acinetobacter sp. WCHA39]